MSKDCIKQNINLMEYPIWSINKNDKRYKFSILSTQGRYTFEAHPDYITDDVDMLFLYYFLYSAQRTRRTSLKMVSYGILTDLKLPMNSNYYKRIIDSVKKMAAGFHRI